MLHKIIFRYVWGIFLPLILVFCPKRLPSLDFWSLECIDLFCPQTSLSNHVIPLRTFFCPTIHDPTMFLVFPLACTRQGILKINFHFAFMIFAPRIIPAWEKIYMQIGWGFFTLYELEEAWKLWSFTRKLQNSCNHVITTVNEMETTKYSNWFVMQNKCFLLFSQT